MSANQKKNLRHLIRGWLPQKPQESDNKHIINMTNPYTRTQTFLKVGGLLLPIIGTALLVIFSFGGLLTLYDLELASKVARYFFFIQIGGIAAVIVGVTFRMRTTRLMVLPIQKPYLAIGLALITVSISGYIFGNFTNYLTGTYPYSVNSLLVRLLIADRTWWLSPLFLSVCFGGCLILLVGRKILLKTSWSSSLFRGAFYALVIGAIFTFVGSFFEIIVLPSRLSFSILSLVAVPLTYFYAFVYPFAILGLTFGWVILTSAHLSKHPFLFTTLYAAFLIVAVAIFSISI